MGQKYQRKMDRISVDSQEQMVQLAIEQLRGTGITVRMSFPKNGSTRTCHICVYEGGYQIIQWWPSTGTVLDVNNAESYRGKTWQQFVEIVRKVLAVGSSREQAKVFENI